MCGIAGFTGEGTEADLRAMSQSLVHRGPDGEGIYIDRSSRVFLAHRRLAILDVQGGGQPMWNEDGQVCVVFNGEIYNHLELREELILKGHVFRSHHSDTEVLLHGYEEWGVELAVRLSGMFAFAVYNKHAGTLFLARDRFGKKPLYYSIKQGSFTFASELKSLLQHRGVDRAISRRAVQKYFAYGFIPAPHSLYRDVLKLPAGYFLEYRISDGYADVRQYWQFKIEPHETIPRNPEGVWGEELRHLLSVAVKRRLMSDVSLGVFLSGGIDSSAITALVARHMPAKTVKTFSIGFNEPSFDESIFARKVADLLGTDHYEEMLDIDMAKGLSQTVLNRLDEPLGDSSILPTYLLCEFSRRYVTVALGGDGGDELFAGYDPFRALTIAKWYRSLVPSWLNGGFRRLVDILPKSNRNMSFDFKMRRSLRGVSYPESMWNPVWLGALEPAEIAELFNENIEPEDLYEEAINAWNNTTSEHVVDKTMEFYTRFYLQDDILTKVDRASMMVSLEVRAPFLDNDVVEFVRKIPHDFKYRNGETKYLLKKSLEGILPKDILYRKKKGFGIPLKRWLQDWEQPEAGTFTLDTNMAWISQKWAEHRHGSSDYRHFMWCYLVLYHHFCSMADSGN